MMGQEKKVIFEEKLKRTEMSVNNSKNILDKIGKG